jgi:hypothetical protein
MDIRKTLLAADKHQAATNPSAALWGLALATALSASRFLSWWIIAKLRPDLPVVHTLLAWDGRHYASIGWHGYEGASRAFYPLSPAILRLFHPPGVNEAAVLGALLSTFFFIASIALLAAMLRPNRGGTELGASSSGSGLVLLAASPAAWVFNTAHTEGLFLLLSSGALICVTRRRFLGASLLCAAACWTRNQGVVLSLAVLLAAREVGASRRTLLTQILVPGVSVLAFLLWQRAETGDILAFAHAQSNWSHARSPLELLRTFWFGNPWQNHNWGSVLRHLYFFGAVAFGILLFRSCRSMGFYVLTSMGLLLLQGELVNAFRFSTVLFPLFFFVGERLQRVPAMARIPLLLAWTGLSFLISREAAYGKWAY